MVHDGLLHDRRRFGRSRQLAKVTGFEARKEKRLLSVGFIIVQYRFVPRTFAEVIHSVPGNHMDVRQLRVFLAVMEKGSLGRAAEWLNTSQPAVTKTIQRL